MNTDTKKPISPKTVPSPDRRATIHFDNGEKLVVDFYRSVHGKESSFSGNEKWVLMITGVEWALVRHVVPGGFLHKSQSHDMWVLRATKHVYLQSNHVKYVETEKIGDELCPTE